MMLKKIRSLNYYMLTNQLVEDGDNYYYVDANGAMLRTLG